MRFLAVAGAVAVPLWAAGCSGVMNVAGAGMLTASEEDADYAAVENAHRAGSTSRKLQVPSLMAAENADGYADPYAGDARDRPLPAFDQFTTGSAATESDEPPADPSDREPRSLASVDSLAALSDIQPTGEDSPRTPAASRAPSRVATRRPPRPVPTGPISIFAEPALPADREAPRDRRGDRDSLRLAAAQEDVPARRNGNGNGANGERTDFDPTAEDVMTVEQIVHWTAQNHPTIEAMRAEIAVAESALLEASLWPNPQFTIDTDNPTQETGGTEVSYRLMFTIPMGGKRALAQQVADLGIRRAQLAVSRETEVVVDEAIAAAMEVVYYQEMLEMQGELAALANELVRRIEGTVIPKPDQITASVNQTGVEFQRLDTLSRLRVARARLSLAMGFDPPRAIHVRAKLPDTPAPTVGLDTLLAAVRENRPEIAEARLAIAESRRARALASAEAVPDLELGPRFRDEFRAPGDSMGARFQFDLPLFWRNQGGIAEADATMRLNQANLRLTQMTTLNDVVAAYAELEPMQRQLEYYSHKVPRLAEEAKAAIEGGFALGNIDANKMANEQQRLGRLKIEHLNLRYQYNRVRAKIELFAGRSLDQLAEMEAAQNAAGERGSPFRDDPVEPEPPPKPAPPRSTRSAPPANSSPKSATTAPKSNTPQPRTATPKTAPATPKPSQQQVDSRVARRTSPSGVVPVSAEETERSAPVSLLGNLKKLVTPKPSPDAAALPYGDAKPSGAASAKK